MSRRCDSPAGAGAGVVGAAPALPPRSSHSPATEQPPPLPPPRGAHNPPPTPPRGTTPPPPLPPHNAGVVMNGHTGHTGVTGHNMNGNHQMFMRRMSPVPGGGRQQLPVVTVTRGQSPVARSGQPMVVTNSYEAQQQVT